MNVNFYVQHDLGFYLQGQVKFSYLPTREELATQVSFAAAALRRCYNSDTRYDCLSVHAATPPPGGGQTWRGFQA